ncbi:HEPN domain-containing protein [Ralstonia sp. 24A2]|uniref:ApeA N-terminal domain 1-containing protein n=1 Tax=Ralstonia sp. 24A2 TaxID=3447364 RepID=UPI003F696908
MAKNAEIRSPGIFTMPDGQNVIGDLWLRRNRMNLTLHSHQKITRYREPSLITGVLGDLRKVSCLHSILEVLQSGRRGDSGSYHYAKILPNFVTVGDHYLEPDKSCISSIQLTTQDIGTLFHDFGAFQHTFLSKHDIDLLRGENGPFQDVEFGEHPDFFYFSGKQEIISVETELGQLRVHHRPSYRMGQTTGELVRNSMVIELAFGEPVNFGTCLDRVLSIHRFLSLMAGRRQSVDATQITITGKDRTIGEGIVLPAILDLYWKYAPKKSKGNSNSPHAGDLPLSPSQRPEEFSTVLSNWLAREHVWRQARVRYMGCLGKGQFYDIDRLVAAANMFDILPPEAIAATSTLPDQLENARKQCRAIFRKLPEGPERSSILGALGRMDKPSLTKKVLHRVNIVTDKIGNQLPDLSRAATVAVKIRNYFVHGSLDGIDHRRLEPLLPFLTETLEFIFAASDLIDSGWDAKRWVVSPYGTGHSFARFRWGYNEHIQLLHEVLNQARA